MTRLRLLSAIALSAIATGASASSFVVTTDELVRALDASSDGTTRVSSSLKDKKLILAAREDAASFVASNGAIRGVQLEGALDAIHEQLPQLNATDAQLAEAILTF
ncbi:MAG: DUF2388 domain-containing protein [Pseudomonas sp.]